MNKNKNDRVKYLVENFQTNNSWNYWFAGVVDGDGCFYINKKKEISFEITTATSDINILHNIKNELQAGSIKLRSGSNSVRYRVKANLIIKNIVFRLNGKLYNPARLDQFKKACLILNIIIKPTPLLIQTANAYLSGLIDANGTIVISVSKTNSILSQKSGKQGKIARLSRSKGSNQMYLKITSIYKDLLVVIQNSYKLGVIYTEKKSFKNKKLRDQYQWIIRDYDDLTLLYELLKTYPLKSRKMHRIRLILKYFNYKELKYHLSDFDTIEHEIWLEFCKKWFKYN